MGSLWNWRSWKRLDVEEKMEKKREIQEKWHGRKWRKRKNVWYKSKTKTTSVWQEVLSPWKERADEGSHYHNLRQGKPIQERWARLLHQEAGVPEGPCGFKELQKFQDFLGPQGYQLIVVEPSKCLVVFKDPTYNEAPHVIGLVKYNGHYDGLTSIPALMNRSYYCRHCDRGYDREQARHHNCIAQNCSACCRLNKTCPNFATRVKPTVHCPDCNCMFYGQDCFQAHKTKGKKRRRKCLWQMEEMPTLLRWISRQFQKNTQMLPCNLQKLWGIYTCRSPLLHSAH